MLSILVCHLLDYLQTFFSFNQMLRDPRDLAVESALRRIPLHRKRLLTLVPVSAILQWIRESSHSRDPTVTAVDLQCLGQRVVDDDAGGTIEERRHQSIVRGYQVVSVKKSGLQSLYLFRFLRPVGIPRSDLVLFRDGLLKLQRLRATFRPGAEKGDELEFRKLVFHRAWTKGIQQPSLAHSILGLPEMPRGRSRPIATERQELASCIAGVARRDSQPTCGC